ncbi:hypothetical protein EC991_008829 [Linnemannia zychae]|nr:hypothetical protein EC991_008829 [Linnemannia zychae]
MSSTSADGEQARSDAGDNKQQAEAMHHFDCHVMRSIGSKKMKEVYVQEKLLGKSTLPTDILQVDEEVYALSVTRQRYHKNVMAFLSLMSLLKASDKERLKRMRSNSLDVSSPRVLLTSQLGLAHCDVKPENLLFSVDLLWRMLDKTPKSRITAKAKLQRPFLTPRGYVTEATRIILAGGRSESQVSYVHTNPDCKKRRVHPEDDEVAERVRITEEKAFDKEQEELFEQERQQ